MKQTCWYCMLGKQSVTVSLVVDFLQVEMFFGVVETLQIELLQLLPLDHVNPRATHVGHFGFRSNHQVVRPYVMPARVRLVVGIENIVNKYIIIRHPFNLEISLVGHLHVVRVSKIRRHVGRPERCELFQLAPDIPPAGTFPLSLPQCLWTWTKIKKFQLLLLPGLVQYLWWGSHFA